jgi:hypothetical protein
MHSKGLDMVRMFNSTVYDLQKQIATTGDPPLSGDIAIIKSTTELIQNISSECVEASWDKYLCHCDMSSCPQLD